jgi:hypothetical protein
MRFQSLILKAVLSFAPFALAGASWAGWQVRDYRAVAQLATMEANIAKVIAAASHQEVSAEKEARAKEVEAQIRTDSIISAAALEAQFIAKANKAIEREVSEYAKSPAALQCGLDADGVRILNNAATPPKKRTVPQDT